MKIITFVITAFLFISLSFIPVHAETLEQAYSLFYKGDKAEAISIIEDYEMQEMDKSRESFTKAYKMKSFFSPIPEDKN